MRHNTILVLGAGRSSASLIDYLLRMAPQNDWKVIVGDLDCQAAEMKIGDSKFGTAITFNPENISETQRVIQSADVVISLLPPFLHPKIARICLQENKHFLSASYVSDEMKALDQEAKSKGLTFLNECGLDPGIDHMSAVQLIDKIKNQGGNLISFESFTGGLITPASAKNNPWQYKFTWNPRNVVTAGQGTSKFLEEGEYKYIPYHQLFSRTTSVHVPGYGYFEGYPNRDSLKYLEAYGLNGIRTMLRGTLRYDGFCSAWNILVQMGCCEDTYPMEGVDRMSHRTFFNSFISYDDELSMEDKFMKQFNLSVGSEEMKKFQWIGMFDEEPVGLPQGTPASILEHILNKKWKLEPSDKDMVVMWHRFRYELNGLLKETQASLIATGDDAVYTAMAKTVGLPLAIAAKLLYQDKIKTRGVIVPTYPEIYNPVLQELKELGIALTEREIS